MNKRALDNLKKLKGRSPHELRVRSGQALAAYAERAGLSAQSRVPSDAAFLRLLDASQFKSAKLVADDLLEHFRHRAAPQFFAAFDDRAATREALQNRPMSEQQALIEKAERITEGRFDLLGFRDLYFGDPVDWHLEPIAGKRSPLVHWSLIDELDSGATGDKKIVWELSRHQYFATLGRAYCLTQDERYAQTFATHLSQWMDANPPKLGLNWISSLEVAYRAISWLWALYYFKDSAPLTPELFTRALKYLHLHARHLETYLSTYSSPNTHLTGEALGLFYLGLMLPEFRHASNWREQGRRILLDELERHVLSDGVYFERATYYHRYTTDFYTHFLILSSRNGAAISPLLEAKLQSLLDHLMYIQRPDGTTPFIGDDDGGRLMKLDEREANDFRATLSTGAALFERADYKHVAREAAEETFWLLGSEGLRSFQQLASQTPAETSRAFPEGGYYVMRDGWTSDANYLLLDCGPHGALSCGHAHADALSFEMAVRGRSLLVDTGTYTYTGSPELRDYFRSSAAHNTLVIDGMSSSVPGGAFSWRQSASATAIGWESHDRFDYFAGVHDGYMRLENSPATHTRSLLFLKNDYCVMRDAVETSGEHRYDLHFHFNADALPMIKEAEEGDSFVNELRADAPGLRIYTFAQSGEWQANEGWVSNCYGARVAAPVKTFTADGTGRQEFFSFLIPQRARDAEMLVHEIEAIGGCAFEIRNSKWRDVLLCGDGTMVKAGRIASDGKMAWTRFSNDEEMLEEFVLIGGSHLQLDGQEILSATRRAGYAVAHRSGDKLRLEIDGEISESNLPVNELMAIASLRSEN